MQPSDMWDNPEYENVLKHLNGKESEMFASLEVAHPLAMKFKDGNPLSAAERSYLKRFLSSNICKEFFCRMNFAFEDIPRCWDKGKPPTDDQCTQCVLIHAMQTTMRVSNKAVEERAYLVTLTTNQQPATSQPSVTYTWEPTKPTELDKGLVGSKIGPVMPDVGSHGSDVFPVCVPSLGKGFDDTKCGQQCSTCPGHGYYDSKQQVLLTDLGTVIIGKDRVKQPIRDKLDGMVKASRSEADHKLNPPQA